MDTLVLFGFFGAVLGLTAYLMGKNAAAQERRGPRLASLPSEDHASGPVSSPSPDAVRAARPRHRPGDGRA